GDLVPDRLDRCPGTPDGTPTDDKGCPQDRVTPDPGEEERLQSALAGAVMIVNPSCKSAPIPKRAKPLAWGRGKQTILGTVGINLAVRKVGGMPPGCALFYELELRFIDPAQPNVPPAHVVHVMFRDAEDLLKDPQRAVFGLPIGSALSPGRSAALDDFLHN